MRTPIKAGDLTFNDIFSVFPFNNSIVIAGISGQVLLDMLEMGMMMYPEEHGAFPHMSGVTFSLNTSIPSSVKVDENGFFIEVDGTYRVYNVKILNKESGVYESLDLNKMYSFAAINYYILDFGGGLAMFKNATILENEGTLDVEFLERYITDNLNGVFGDEYKDVVNRITYTDGFESTSEESVVEKYSDLEEGAWYKDAAEFVISNGLMEGVSEDSFAPDAEFTRDMAVTVLWRMEGCPVANYAMTFKDVEADAWHTEAVRWAAATGIVNGYSEEKFAPGDIINREQLAAIMWRYAKYKKTDVSVGENTNILSYEDVFDVSEYAIPAFQWTCGSGIMSGNTQSTLAPKETVSRIYFASVIHKYTQSVK